MRNAVFLAAIVTFWSSSATAEARLSDHQEDAGEFGDVLQYVVPAAALSLTFMLASQEEGARLNFDSDDLLYLNGSPRHDLLLAMARTGLVTGTLKYAVHERRPNRGLHSFPSGHTSFAFTGAEFIRKEYGWGWGIPAYVAASVVGWSRVEARAHFTHDVLAGAAIGILANHDWYEHDTRYGKLRLAPAVMSVGGESIGPGARNLRPAFGLQFDLRFH